MSSQRIAIVCVVGASLALVASIPAEAAPVQPVDALKAMSIEELMNLEVTSVARRPQKLSETSASISVITANDIRRSGATSLPEALRLAGNLELAQINGPQWAISARGFNAPLSNKMLVMIDGRTVYSPLFSGVFWDIQDVVLEDVERIEVISGPGATLWGANAVNGVINITTKNSRDTQGVYAEAGGGDEVPAFGVLRYGGQISEDTRFRVYGEYGSRDSAVRSNGVDPGNDWKQVQGGFRADHESATHGSLTLQGDAYESTIRLAGPEDLVTRGANLLGRWSRNLSTGSDVRLQVYVDRVHRDSAASFDDTLETYDVDFQHHIVFSERQDVVWGAGYRLVSDDFQSGVVGLRPADVSLDTVSAFAQDEIALRPDILHLTLGAKLEDNDYTGFSIQPSLRVAWQVHESQLLWGAISRALRTPARIDRDYYVPPLTFGSPNLEAEELIAYELGYRVQPYERVSVSLTGYYDDYDDIRSIEPVNPPAPIPLVFGNGQKAEGYGFEGSVEYRATDSWRLRAEVSELRLFVRPKSGSLDTSHGNGEAADSKHHVLVRSSWDLPRGLELDATYRYVSRIENPAAAAPGYSELDLRMAWLATERLEFSIVGQNLLHDRHLELGPAVNGQEIQRGVYGKIAWRH
jgi:iron complex outermembrane receptor protein